MKKKTEKAPKKKVEYQIDDEYETVVEMED